MNTFRHNTNERNKTNVIKLRMKYGAAGYGIYIMLLERLALEPQHRLELDYDVLAFDFQESSEMIRHIVEDFDLFNVDIDSQTFSHDDLDRQALTKAEKARQEEILDDYIRRKTENDLWIDTNTKKYETSPERIRQLVRTSFRDKILAAFSFIPEPPILTSILRLHIAEAFRE